MEPNKNTQSQGGEIPLDYFLWNDMQGVPLCGLIEGGFTVTKHEIRQAPLKIEGDPKNKEEFSALIKQSIKKTIEQLVRDLNLPLTVLSDLFATLQLTHPIQKGLYYNHNYDLVPLESLKPWEGYFDWNGDIKFGETKGLDKYANKWIKHFKIIKNLGDGIGWAQFSFCAYTILTEGNKIWRGEFNSSKLIADSSVILIGLKGGPKGIVISCIYGTVDAVFEKDGVGGIERGINFLREKLFNFYAPIGANIDACIKNMINFNCYY